MKFYTSYFYQIRFFPRNLIPLSTACYDPKWYHNNKGQKYQFFDKRNVINGIRIEPFVPGSECKNLCRGPEYCNSDPSFCKFLYQYKIQLNNLDTSDILKRFTNLANKLKIDLKLQDIDFALIFHEPPTRACSERWTVQKWFKDNNLEINEWTVKK